MATAKPPGAIRRALRWLFSPSARWSVFALLLVGLVIGAVMVIGTQVAVAVTGTDQFCGTTCHSHEKFVYPEHQQTVALRQPDRRAGDVRRLPRPAQLPEQADRQGGEGHRRRLRRAARHDFHAGEVRSRALAPRQQGVGRDARGQLGELPSLPRPAGDGTTRSSRKTPSSSTRSSPPARPRASTATPASRTRSRRSRRRRRRPPMPRRSCATKCSAQHRSCAVNATGVLPVS